MTSRAYVPDAGDMVWINEGFGTGAQVQIAAAVAQPVASVQPPFDLYGSSTKPRTNFFPH